MPLSERETALVEDMLVHARLISAYVEGISVDQYLADRKTQLAVERLARSSGRRPGNVRGCSANLTYPGGA